MKRIALVAYKENLAYFLYSTKGYYYFTNSSLTLQKQYNNR